MIHKSNDVNGEVGLEQSPSRREGLVLSVNEEG